MTGYADQRERADDLMTKVIDVVDKPFSLPDIRKAVAQALSCAGLPPAEAKHCWSGCSFQIEQPLQIITFHQVRCGISTIP